MIHLQPQLFENLKAGGRGAVIDALQKAVQLEHATIPLYLYALYSLDETKNSLVASIIQSVVVEEMLHLVLACNVMSAIGGSPVIDEPCFIPKYPGPLPGGVESDLRVHLAPFSCEQLRAFLKIEEPENPLHFPDRAALKAAPPITIGQFYAEIKRQIAALTPGTFSATPRNQIGPDLMDGAVVVTDAATAQRAIDVIIWQGEGTLESPLEAVNSQEFAHYYRFEEIAHGKRLIKNSAGPNTPPDQQYCYGGAPVTFNTSGVFAVPTDPLAAKYASGSAARHVCDTFNYNYTNLLKTLHTVLNGTPAEFNSAMGLMFSLKQQAIDMMAGKNPSGVFVGPSFEYQPNNPG